MNILTPTNNELKQDRMLSSLKNLKKIAANFTIKDFDDSNDFCLGFTFVHISSESIFDRCMAEIKYMEYLSFSDGIRTLLEYEIDGKFLTIAWESPGCDLPYKLNQLFADSLLLDEMEVFDGEVRDNDGKLKEHPEILTALCELSKV